MTITVSRAPVIDADRNRIEQVVLNVPRIAARAIGGDGRIEVFIDDAGLTVAGTGSGIAEEARAESGSPSSRKS